MADVKSKARQKFLALETPSPNQSGVNQNRERWIDKLCSEFVQPSNANKRYYKVVVETLWPSGHGIPGPLIKQDEIREAINQYRRRNRYGSNPDKPYVDVFRRVRELQGEEGLIGVARQGHVFQLVNLTVGPKRIPRTKLSDDDWNTVLRAYKSVCAVCKRKEPEVRFQQDHKIPRTRSGSSDKIDNWQPLCDECNNFKSTSCRACNLDCTKCCWAFPEIYPPLTLKPDLAESLRRLAAKNNENPQDILNQVINNLLASNEIES